MKKNNYLLLAIFCIHQIYSQVPFTHISTSTFNAERVASFGVIDTNTDFLEITNSTQFDNSFIPSIWAHQQSDNRFVLRLFATTNSTNDYGSIPMMIFRAEIRNNLNPQAPTGGSFPWGTLPINVSSRPLFGWENGNTQLMRIMSNGFVGINTTNPTALFHTKGSVRFENLPTITSNRYILTTDVDGNVSSQLSSSFSGSGITNSCGNTNFVLKNGTTDISCSNIFDNGTGVGIGTTSPTAIFHTNGSLRFENIDDKNNPTKILGTDISGNVFEYNPTDLIGSHQDYDWLRPDGTLATSIDDNIYTNGKVGVNTNIFPSQVGDVDVSSYSLFVKGGILTEEVRVALSSDWADYVFDEDYQLEPLSSVEKYIQKNKHLKDVPDAEHVKKEGIELGEMNKILLLKVEELTLHLISMEKKIQALEAEIKKTK
ncbi:MAG: tail fiber protein [Flavobacteriaceae bacterium]